MMPATNQTVYCLGVDKLVEALSREDKNVGLEKALANYKN